MRRDRILGPVLVGTLAASLIAGRLEVAFACVALAALLAGIAGARWPARGWWTFMTGGALVAVVLNAYLTPGAPAGWPAVLGREASADGIRHGALLAARLWGAAVALLGLASLWPGERAADAIAGWLSPLERVRVPVREARAILGLAFRFAPLLRDEFRRIEALQGLRAGRPPRNLPERVRRLESSVIPSVVAALERADRVALALEARHYRLAAPRTTGAEPLAVGTGLAMVMVALFWRG